MTFGLSGAGYDIRLAEDTWLWPWRCTLRSSIEHFCLPWDLLFKVHDKSTNARRGVLVQNTVAEPGWHGYLTLEITKEWRWPYIHKLRRGTPIAQVIFHRLEERTDQPYKGKYQNQATGPQGAIMERPHKRPAMLDEYNVKDWMRP
jgi:dCTP deaminase